MAGRDTSGKRASILDAAFEVFRSEGYESASMDRIAEVAHASKRTVYNHFDGKEALFAAVTERFLEEMSALQAIDYDPDADLAEQLAAFALAKERILSDPSWLGMARVGLGVVIRDPALARDILARARRGEDHLTRWLRAAADDGRLAVPEPAFAAELYWEMIAGTIVWPQLLHGPMKPAHVARLRAEVIGMFLSRHATAAEPDGR